jgi:hypothetical protein
MKSNVIITDFFRIDSNFSVPVKVANVVPITATTIDVKEVNERNYE